MGAVVNDVPVARQSRDPARPQAGESLPLEYRQKTRRRANPCCIYRNHPKLML